MKTKILMFVLEQLFGLLTPELLTEGVDKVLDFFEEKIAESETKIDDRIALPLIAMVREAFNIPDND